MRRPIITLLACALGVSTTASAQTSANPSGDGKRFEFCKADGPRFGVSSWSVDSAHPRYFVQVSEMSRRGHARTILTSRPHPNDSTTRLVCERVNYPIDRDAKIVISVDRMFLRESNFEGNFSVCARIEGQGSSRAIEVPGYCMIGEKAQIAPVGVAAASTMAGMLNEIDETWRTVQLQFNVLRQRADSIAQLQGSARVRRMAEGVEQVRALDRTVAQLSLRRDSLTALARGTGHPDSVTIRSSLIDVAADLVAKQASLQQAREQLQRDSTEQRVLARPTFVRQALAILRAQRSVLLVLREFPKPANASLIEAAAKAQQRLPATMIDLAARADTLWGFLISQPVPDSTSRAELRAMDELIEELESIMTNLRRSDVSPAVRNRRIREHLLSAVKDAQLDVRQSGAQVGDVIVITLTDSVGTNRSDRVAIVRLPVRDFGLVQRISDAILMLNLPGQSNEAELRQAAAAATTANSVELPVATRGSPTAGVSFGWVYSPRRDDEYSPLAYPVRVVGSWLEPGFGLAATAASVPMKKITFAPGAAPSEEASDNQVAYTLGGFFSVFDGALVFSSGWTLNGNRARSYTGIGLSFLSATEKAKELFKGLNP